MTKRHSKNDEATRIKKQGSSRGEVSKRSTNENYKKAYVQLSRPPSATNVQTYSDSVIVHDTCTHGEPKVGIQIEQKHLPGFRIVSEGSHRLFPLNCSKSSGRFGRTWRHAIAILALNHKSRIRSTRNCRSPLPKPSKKTLGLEWSVRTSPRFAIQNNQISTALLTSPQ